MPANITLLPLPPKCPELNPVENVWQFMRDNWLSNRVFTSYDDIVAHNRAAATDHSTRDPDRRSGLEHLPQRPPAVA